MIHRRTLLHVIASYDRGFTKRGREREEWRERERGMKGGERERDTQRQRERDRENPSSQIKMRAGGEWKKVLGSEIRKHEKNKTKCILTLQPFLYICTNLPWSFMGPTLGGLALLGTSNQPAVFSFHLESADSE